MDNRVLFESPTHTNVEVLDGVGAGGAHHHYLVFSVNNNLPLTEVCLQKGPIKEFGVNGCQNEDLLAIVKDRLECFQRGNFACTENAEALRHVEAAMDVLTNRTKKRTAMGIEGINVNHEGAK